MTEVVELVINLINAMAVLLVVTYLVTRTDTFCEVASGRQTPKSTAFLVLVFGGLGCYGTLSGIHLMGAVANIRYIGPVVAGLLGGPVAGLGAGLLAGLHRYFLAGGAAPAGAPELAKMTSTVSTVVAGLAAGLYHRLTFPKTGKFISIRDAALFALVVQFYQCAQTWLFAQPHDQAVALVKVFWLPMFLANGLGTALFFLIVHNVLKERETRAQRDHYLAQKQKIEGELTVARDIQMSMVPKMLPSIPTWPDCDLYASLHSAREVGGDFYDFFIDQAGRLVFTIGDVSDKGVPAALLMAVTKTLMKGLHEPGLSPSDLLERVNREVSEENDTLMFVTVFCGVLDFTTGEFWFSNAGHNPPLLLRGGREVDWLKLPRGFVLGPDGTSKYVTDKIVLAPGDALVTYTDGVTEAMNRERKLFSEARLIELVRAGAAGSPEQLVKGIADAVKAHAGEEPQSDDITILAIKFKSFPGGAP